jgi:hypothetical protein
MELVRSSPLRPYVLKAAWPALSVESKLHIIGAVASQDFNAIVPDYVVDLALGDPTPIVRYWGARSFNFSPVRFNEPLPPDELERKARADSDECDLVRAAASAQGLTSGLIELPQLARLVMIRALARPRTGDFVTFLWEAISKGRASVDEVVDCVSEYLSRKDVQSEVEALKFDDRANWYYTQKAWKELWTLAASAPVEIGAAIAQHAHLEVGYPSVDQFAALPHRLKEILVWRHGTCAEQLRESVKTSPEKHGKDIVDQIRLYDEGFARHKQLMATEALYKSPTWQDTAIAYLRELRQGVEQQAEAIAVVPKAADLSKATQQILNWVVGIGLGVGALLYIMISSRHS